MIRWIFNYFRQCFCRHELELIKEIRVFESDSDFMPVSSRKVYFCKRCGYVKRIRL